MKDTWTKSYSLFTKVALNSPIFRSLKSFFTFRVFSSLVVIMDNSTRKITADCGYEAITKSPNFKILENDGWNSTPITYPAIKYLPCVLALNDSMIVAIGGISSTSFFSTSSFLIDWNSKTVKSGPSTLYGRFGHGCARIKMAEASKE